MRECHQRRRQPGDHPERIWNFRPKKNADRGSSQKQITNGFTLRYLKQPEVVSGIEMRVNGHKIAWSLNEYLETMVENLN